MAARGNRLANNFFKCWHMHGLREELPMRRVPNALHARRASSMLPMRCLSDEMPMRRVRTALHSRFVSRVLPMRCLRGELP